MKEVLNLFIDDAPGKVEQIKVGLRENNIEEIRRAAHTLKGAAANIIAEGVRKAAEIIEHSDADNETDDLEEKLRALEEEMDKPAMVIADASRE